MASTDSPGSAALSFQALDLVEPALRIPPDLSIRGSSKPDAAVVVDRELRRLSGAEARVGCTGIVT